MKVLLLGADGFIGSKVRQVLAADHEVHGSSRDGRGDNTVKIDLLNRHTIAEALKEIRPEVIINCAGVVEDSKEAEKNFLFTSNLLVAALASSLSFKSIFISGSAAEYGVVDKSSIPVTEDVPLNANSGYGLSKLKESTKALEYRYKHNLPVIVGRIFNPIGAGMHPKFIIPGIMRQIDEIQGGKKDVIEVSRLDSKRDYIAVSDIAEAIKVLIEAKPKHSVYNIGSGKTTSNKELIDLVLENSNLSEEPKLVETSDQPEPLIAIQADITRITNEFDWRPTSTIEQTIREIVRNAGKR
jgi:nucleoside-diphosphate-sugar epimerase